MGGNMFLIPADERTIIAVMPLAHCREAVFTFHASKRTMPSAAQATGNRHVRHLAWHATRYRRIQVIIDSYFSCKHTETPFAALRPTALPTALKRPNRPGGLAQLNIARYDIVVHQIMRRCLPRDTLTTDV